MEKINLLKFLNKAKRISFLEYANMNKPLINFIDCINDDLLINNIDFGVIFFKDKYDEKYIVIDGYRRLVSLSLLLHAICECYKKTSTQNDKAIKTIRTKYLFTNNSPKLNLNGVNAEIYNKIINGEKLSGREKQSEIFQLLHNLWSKIKEDKLQAGNIFKTLQKISIVNVPVEDVNLRDLYYSLHKNDNVNQIELIENYCKEYKIEQINTLFDEFFENSDDSIMFLQDFLITKFNYKELIKNNIYEAFTNYFASMLKYIKKEEIVNQILDASKLYKNILYINIEDSKLKELFIKIQQNNGDDTYAYLLEIYKDYNEQRISYDIFVEILITIVDYLEKRKDNGNEMPFNTLIQYLNTFITCK